MILLSSPATFVAIYQVLSGGCFITTVSADVFPLVCLGCVVGLSPCMSINDIIVIYFLYFIKD